MTARMLLDRPAPDVRVWHASHSELAARFESTGTTGDLLCVDAPYSARTHAGHDVAAESITDRRSISYDAWTEEDVRGFVATWAPLTVGWLVTLTDHVLAPAWTEALEAAGRYVFSPLACVEPGSRVRIVGDGPAQWSTWLVVSRPRSGPWSKWGALPGAYVLPRGYGGAKALPGGKPLWLMERIVEDYSRPGDVVVDPCCGAGTTLLAAIRTGRRAIGGDASEDHALLAATILSGPVQAPLLGLL